MSSLQDSNQLAVSVKDLHLSYRANVTKKPNIKEAIVNLGRGKRSTVTVDALRGVSFDVKHGSVLGIIGANGAGKSTIMKSVAGILPPTKGEIHLYGKVSAMLSLGVGFNPNLSGRENVFLGGLAAGLTREEIEGNFQKVVDFADIGDHIEMPMRTYSAGMYGRLGFAVATTINPEILLIDEALSTGDAAFKEKSSQRIHELCGEDRTLLIGSHGLGTIEELCTDALWLHQGEVVLFDKPEKVIEGYTKFLHVGNVASVMEDF